MRKTVAVIAEKLGYSNNPHWQIVEIDQTGNKQTILDVGKNQPVVSCSGTHAYIAYNGIKYLYDYSKGFGTGQLRGM